VHTVNNRALDMERLRYILETYSPGRMDANYLCVELLTPDAEEWYKRLASQGNGSHVGLRALLTCLNDTDGTLIPESTERRIEEYRILRELLGLRHTQRVTTEDLIRAQLVDDTKGQIFAGVQLHAVTGNHSSYAGRLWKLGVDPDPERNPKLLDSIRFPTNNIGVDVTRRAMVFVWRSFSHKVADVNMGAMLLNLAAAENRQVVTFRRAVQNYQSILSSGRAAVPTILEYMRGQLRCGCQDVIGTIATLAVVLPSYPQSTFRWTSPSARCW
jgi:hypothetical protein